MSTLDLPVQLNSQGIGLKFEITFISGLLKSNKMNRNFKRIINTRVEVKGGVQRRAKWL